ncbi:hypothetical protein SAMN05443572_104542 [Myxococcus fulvus]|uniref:Lipoprotein n=1 Tax=Myxococcus fulvus TaxID=33 RepID=A0A511SZU8_MYXFU|nr:hypothetical protein [Myxococcus fulvus]GEN06833.1 hypothetical protein MFU01_18700 [Myxococcus fulvus]SEU04362.1 hypothetical protein SAMN05443572_104542 [Myxococcus fulvus]
MTSRGLLLLALALLTGCPGDLPPEECFLTGAAEPPTLVIAEGKAVSVRVPAASPQVCDTPEDAHAPESVTVEVHGPDNLPVPATVELQTNTWFAVVRFTPTATGRHHVIVAFAPVGSLRQFDVHVAQDERSRTPVATLDARPTCLFVDRTRSGTWLCDHLALREPGTLPQLVGRETQPATAVAGDVVWAMTDTQVRRYVDPGTGPLVLTGTAPLPPGSYDTDRTPHSRLATEDEYLVADATTLHRYIFREAEGVLAFSNTPWSSLATPQLTFGTDSTRAILVRGGDTVWLVSSAQDRVTFTPRTQACPFQVDAQGFYRPSTTRACEVLAGDPVGHGEGVVWTRAVVQTSSGFIPVLHLHEVSAEHGIRETGSLSLDGSIATFGQELRPGPSHPLLEGSDGVGLVATPRWNAERTALVLALLPTPGRAGRITRISDHFTWTVSDSGAPGVRVHPWTSSP